MPIGNQTLGATETTIFTCANANGTAVVGLTFTNTDSVARTITVYARPSAESAADENKILHQFSVDAGETFTFNDKIMLSNTDVISGLASSAGVVVVTISYMNL